MESFQGGDAAVRSQQYQLDRSDEQGSPRRFRQSGSHPTSSRLWWMEPPKQQHLNFRLWRKERSVQSDDDNDDTGTPATSAASASSAGSAEKGSIFNLKLIDVFRQYYLRVFTFWII